MIEAQQIFTSIPCIKSFPQIPRQTPFHETQKHDPESIKIKQQRK